MTNIEVTLSNYPMQCWLVGRAGMLVIRQCWYGTVSVTVAQIHGSYSASTIAIIVLLSPTVLLAKDGISPSGTWNNIYFKEQVTKRFELFG